MLQGSNSIVLLIIIVNVLFSMKGFDDNSFLNKYKFQVGRVLGNEKIRMLTSGFLHVDWMHLGFNMYALYVFGGFVATNSGITSFLIIYFGSYFLEDWILNLRVCRLNYCKVNLLQVIYFFLLRI